MLSYGVSNHRTSGHAGGDPIYFGPDLLVWDRSLLRLDYGYFLIINIHIFSCNCTQKS